MVTNHITCDKCHEEFEWEEPEGYDGVDTMPDGSFISGDWICLDCGSCPVCYASWVERRCDCDPPNGPLYNKFTGEKNVNMGIGNDTGGLENSNEL